MKKTVYQVGDRVKILESKWVKRVGYNLHYEMLIEEARNSPNTLKAYMVVQGLDPALSHLARIDKHKIPYHFLISVAKLMVEHRGFGGNERKIHYHKDSWRDYTGSIQTVVSKRVVNTGDYVAPWYPSSMNPEDEGTPGGLENRKTHVLLMTDVGEIEACNVERVWKAGTK